jgi:hypothetical protein
VTCVRCDNCRWVCENHADSPWLGTRARGCGGAEAPCPICNAADVQADVVDKHFLEDQ